MTLGSRDIAIWIFCDEEEEEEDRGIAFSSCWIISVPGHLSVGSYVFDLRGLHISILPPSLPAASHTPTRKCPRVDIHGRVSTFVFPHQVPTGNIGS